MKMSVFLLAICALVIGVAASGKNPQQMTPVRISYSRQRPHDYQLIFFVQTQSTNIPMATLADNDGYPLMAALYAKPMEFDGMQGVRLHVVFGTNHVAAGVGLAVNLWQPGMRGPFTVSPLN